MQHFYEVTNAPGEIYDPTLPASGGSTGNGKLSYSTATVESLLRLKGSSGLRSLRSAGVQTGFVAYSQREDLFFTGLNGHKPNGSICGRRPKRLGRGFNFYRYCARPLRHVQAADCPEATDFKLGHHRILYRAYVPSESRLVGEKRFFHNFLSSLYNLIIPRQRIVRCKIPRQQATCPQTFL
jgi:hypothetical protein